MALEAGLQEFIEKMPKIELHMHIEGSLEPELMMDMARRNGLEVPYGGDVAKAKAARKFNNLQEFLDLYYEGMNVLRTEQDFYDLTMAYLKKAKEQGVTHTEIFFDPQGHTERGVAFATAINGIHRALEDGEKELGVSSKLIMCFLRHKSEEDAFKALEEARPFIDMIDGFGLDSSEKGFPPSKFERVFAEARKTGKYLVAHAGEEGPAQYVEEALDVLQVDRIDHGNHALEVLDEKTNTSGADDGLVDRLAREKVGLTVCPLSNLRLCGVKDMKDHPLKTMLDYGLKATVNSDDPAYFGGYVTENFLAVADALNLTRQDIITLAKNAIEVSFLSPEQKQEKTQALDDYIRMQAIKRVNTDQGRSRV